MRHITFQYAFGLPSPWSLLALPFYTSLLFTQTLVAAPKNSITIAFEDNVRSFDPRQSVDANSQYIEDLVHCSLMNFDQDGKAIPGALEAAPSFVSAKVLEMQLRKDQKFSDGNPVRAEDVVATYNSLIKDKKFTRSSAFVGVDRVESIGEGRIRFTLKKPDASFPSNLVVGILKEADTKLAELNPLELKGCGPFKIKSTGINEIALEANGFAAVPPKLSLVTIKIVRNEKTRYAKLRAGEIDIVQNGISRDTLRTLERRNPNLKILKRPSLKTTYVGFNMKDSLVSNPAIRGAISLAVNRQEIINIILNGMAIPANTILPPNSVYHSESLKKDGYDPKAAEAMLDQAGLKRKTEGGFRFEVSLKTTTDVTRISVAKAIASQLKRVGIKVIVEPMEWGRFKLDIDQGRVQLWTLTWVGFKDPDIYRYAFATENFPPNGANRGWYSNPKLDALLESGREKNDFSERKKIYDQVQDIVDQDKPYIFLWHEENFAVVAKDLTGFELYADGRYSALQHSYFK